MNVTPHDPDEIKKLKQLAAIQKNAKQRDRYRAVAMALQGHTINHIMYVLSRSKNFVQRWTYLYRDGGIDAIVPTPQKGRPTILPAEKEQFFKQRIMAGPTPQDNGICTLRGKDAMQILQKEFGVKYMLNAVYALMHRLGLSCLTPRPRHRHNDPAAMEQWLNNAPLLSKQSKKKTRTKKSKCGFRMRPESVSREH
ncbi:MAG: winged helix-turn-helix domain-containing protein [Phycisphaerales bacterium]